jgi:hypothetical protein
MDGYRIDVCESKGHTQIGKPDLYAFAQDLAKIEQDFHRLATGFNHIKADVYNREDREKRKKGLRGAPGTDRREKQKAGGRILKPVRGQVPKQLDSIGHF